MYWANFLHIYQPPNQDERMLREIILQSYKPILKSILANPKVKLNLNINSCLLDLLKKNGYDDVLEMLRDLLKKGQLELTGSAKYHALLPLLPEDEIRRQIEQNEVTLKQYFSDLWVKKGFFPPEMAYDFKLAKIVKEMGYQWILAPQISYGPNPPEFDSTYLVKGLEPFKVYFRDKRVSVVILSGYSHTIPSFYGEIPDVLQNPNRYLLTVMDGETFGHHRPGLENFLDNLYHAKELQTVFTSDLPKDFPKTKVVEPRPATWSAEEQDFWLDKEQTVASSHPFLLWQDPSNEIHKLQWKFTNWVMKEIKDQEPKIKTDEDRERWKKARGKLDEAISSDQYWWASAKPWWSLEFIENGAFYLKEVIDTYFGKESKESRIAFNYHVKILLLGCKWQREGTVRKRFLQTRNPLLDTPFKERANREEYNQIILEFEDEMKKAAATMEYEKAVRWRDAIDKISSGMDIFDAVHMVDQLWTARKLPSLKPYFEMKPEEISDFAKKHLIESSNLKSQISKPNI